MSELPPPPPRGMPLGAVSTPAPPPPPSPVRPPPPPPAGPNTAAPLHRVRRLSSAIVILTIIGAALGPLGAVAMTTATDDADALLANEISESEFLDRVLGAVLLQSVQGVFMLATAVLTMIWMFRLVANHRRLHRWGTWGPGWAIGGWFLPPLLFVIPTLMLRELWKASDPAVPIGGEWKRSATSPLVPLWFVAYSIVPLALTVAQGFSTFSLGSTEQALAEQISGDQTLSWLGALSTVIAAAIWVPLVRGLSARHRRLTGESESA